MEFDLQLYGCSSTSSHLHRAFHYLQAPYTPGGSYLCTLNSRSGLLCWNKAKFIKGRKSLFKHDQEVSPVRNAGICYSFYPYARTVKVRRKCNMCCDTFERHRYSLLWVSEVVQTLVAMWTPIQENMYILGRKVESIFIQFLTWKKLTV